MFYIKSELIFLTKIQSKMLKRISESVYNISAKCFRSGIKVFVILFNYRIIFINNIT